MILPPSAYVLIGYRLQLAALHCNAGYKSKLQFIMIIAAIASKGMNI